VCCTTTMTSNDLVAERIYFQLRKLDTENDMINLDSYFYIILYDILLTNLFLWVLAEIIEIFLSGSSSQLY
jgi:hypothetical protein